MNEVYETQFSDELYHYGRKGMKWYQNIFTKGKERKRKKQRQEALEKARKAKVEKKQKEEAEQELDKAKQKAIKSGDSREILKYKDRMTTQELRDASDRARMINDLNSMAPKQVDKGKEFANMMLKEVVGAAAKDVSKQLVKSGMTYAANNLLKLDDELKVYTNNKKK